MTQKKPYNIRAQALCVIEVTAKLGGLTTVETIGRIYNPTYNEQGEKIAKPSWVSKVNKALEEFVNIDTTVDLATINSLKNQV